MAIQIAKQQTVDDINNKVGTNVDASSTSTVFGWFKKIWDVLATIVSSSRPYKQLKLNNVKSPVIASTNGALYSGMLLKYNDTYDIIVTSNKLMKIRKSDGVKVAEFSISVITLPVIINDYAFGYESGNNISVIDLNTMTRKYVTIPNGSSGGIPNITTGNTSLDFRHVSGNTYQFVAWVDATTDGIIVCSFDVTSASGTTATQVSWIATPVKHVCFGSSGDENYYAMDAVANTANANIRKYPITNPESSTRLILAARIRLIDEMSIRSSQNSKYIALAIYNDDSTMLLSEIVLVDKVNGGVIYTGIIADWMPTYSRFGNVCLNKNDNTIAISTGYYDVFIDTNGQPTFVKKDENQKTAESSYAGQYPVTQLFAEGIHDYNLESNKVWHSGASYFPDSGMTNAFTKFLSLAIREYDII